jgi:hypothetical protein
MERKEPWFFKWRGEVLVFGNEKEVVRIKDFIEVRGKIDF